MKEIKILFLLFLIVTFFVGMYFYSVTLYHFSIPAKPMENMENMENSENKDSSADSNCPDILIKEGNGLLLYNSKKPKEDGVNPLPFFNLDEYINYLEIQKKKGIHCPVLYLQKENDAQGKDVYRFRANPFGIDGGTNPMTMTRAEYAHRDLLSQNPPPTILMNGSTANLDRNAPVNIVDASRQNGNFNAGNYPGFDPQNQYIGIYTNIDRIHDSTRSEVPFSDNPMDPNWGGVVYTENAINSNKYEENNIRKPNYITPRGGIQLPVPGMPRPNDRSY
jgi:hypothetical protein